MNKQRGIDINCDLGESEAPCDWRLDERLMPLIDRCNIACGGHAGNHDSMKHMMIHAMKHNVLLGPHPGYPDKTNFGRQSLDISPDDLDIAIRQQLIDFLEIAHSLGASVSHVKFHGALYNDMERRPELAHQMSELVQELLPNVPILGLSEGQVAQQCELIRHPFLNEAFMDRRYLPNGKLTPRTEEGSVLSDITAVVLQAECIVNGKPVICNDQSLKVIAADSLCLHGDGKNSLAIAHNIQHLRTT